jgi:hypothetical protein
LHQGMTITSCAPAPAVRRTRPLERLEAEIVELSSQLTAASARLIAMVGEFDTAEGWREWGMRSTAHWLSWKCGLALGAGREQVRVARALRDLPVMAAAFGAGRLSYSKVQIERLAAEQRRVARAADVRSRRAAEFLRVRFDDDGSMVGTFRIAPERAAVFAHALAAGCGRVPDAASEGESPPPADPGDRQEEQERRGQRSNVDALLAMAELMLKDVSAKTSPDAAERFQLVLHSTVDELARPDESDDDGAGSHLLALGGPVVRVHPATARRLACDCPTTWMVDGVDGSAVHVGRKTRRIQGRLRRAAHARDRGRCRAPGCTNRADEIHHLRHWANGGPTCLPNLVSLCNGHHWLVHEGGWTMTVRRPGQWALLGPSGVTVGPNPEPHEPSSPLAVDPEVAAAAVAGRWQGDRLHPQPILDYIAHVAERVSAETPDRWMATIEQMNRTASADDAINLDDEETQSR